MGNSKDTLTIPRTGKVQIDIRVTADLNISAMVARRKVNAYLATHLGNFLADEPVLTFHEKIVWRVPVDFTQLGLGRVGRVGEIDVDVETGALLIGPAQLDEIREHAKRLAASVALPANRAS